MSSRPPITMKKMGVMRFVYVIVDYSSAMLDQSLFPSLINVSAKHLKIFLQNFFQLNPIAQIGLIICTDRKPNRLVSFTSDSRILVEALDGLDFAACTGEFSLQSSLNMALQDLQGQPSYASREIIVIMGSLSSIDPGNIFSTIETLKRNSIRCSIIGLNAEIYVGKKLCQTTGGRYDVVMDEGHYKNIFDEHMRPVILNNDTDSDLIPVCFPTREAVFAPPACSCHKEEFSQLDQFFICQQCGAHFCSTPIECTVCGMLLITAPQLARAFQHLTELDKFTEVEFEGNCNACQVHITDNAYECPKCESKFCNGCNDLTHKSLQICPSSLLIVVDNKLFNEIRSACGRTFWSTYCHLVQEHCRSTQRSVFVINLDPAAESFKYECNVDIRDLISVQDVQEDEELNLGPNGALVFCMEYLIGELDWLHDQMNEAEDDYFLIDCPGQIELYSHLPVMRQFCEKLQSWGFNVCSVFLLDSQFLLDADKFISGALTTLSTMVALETPAVSVLSKMDLLEKKDKEFLEAAMEGDAKQLLLSQEASPWNEKHRKLTEIIATVLDEYSLVKFVPLNPDDEENIAEVMLIIDNSIQYGEDLEVRDRYPDEADDLGFGDLGFGDQAGAWNTVAFKIYQAFDPSLNKNRIRSSSTT
ncbi:GPN-loop GTPase 3 [Aphelenchoides bicaudatus]|nr:GPN-loop GTPase 3 [Aphelenchoides bicaudatus]